MTERNLLIFEFSQSILFCFLGRALGTQSLIVTPDQHNGNSICRSLGTLNSKQKSICRSYPDLLVGVAVGAKHAIDECKYQFRSRRWNCPVVSERNSVFGPILKRGKLNCNHVGK